MADLLDRHEGGTDNPIGYPDYPAFADVVEMDSFAKELGEAERAGAVRITKGRGRNSDQIAHVRRHRNCMPFSDVGRSANSPRKPAAA